MNALSKELKSHNKTKSREKRQTIQVVTLQDGEGTAELGPKEPWGPWKAVMCLLIVTPLNPPTLPSSGHVYTSLDVSDRFPRVLTCD